MCLSMENGQNQSILFGTYTLFDEQFQSSAVIGLVHLTHSRKRRV